MRTANKFSVGTSCDIKIMKKETLKKMRKHYSLMGLLSVAGWLFGITLSALRVMQGDSTAGFFMAIIFAPIFACAVVAAARTYDLGNGVVLNS